MARALSHDARLIVMDEPSAVLDQRGGRSNLFRVIRDLTAQGVAVVYISHRLEEIREIGDRVTVLKDGRTVATGLPARETPTTRADPADDRPRHRVRLPGPRDHAPRPDAATVLEVERPRPRPASSPTCSFDVAPGEIVGLAGLVGSGRSEILETVYGARRPRTGTVTVDGKRLRRGSVGAAVAAGVGLAPEERKSQGLLLDQSVYRNITVSSLGRFSRGGFLDAARRARGRAGAGRASLDVRPAGVDRAVRTLSGGNQQKVVLARWLLRECRVLLLDEPTRGVDVGARARDLRADPLRWPTRASPSWSCPARSTRSSVWPTGCW